MTRPLKVSALLTFVLAVVFYLFFQVSKHQPALMLVNPFGDDPYDAVGSLGVQLAMFTALLSLVRAYRPYPSDAALERQVRLFVRGVLVSCLTVLITLLADIVAMARHLSVWSGIQAGSVLACMVGGMVVLTLLVVWYTYHVAQIRPILAARSVQVKSFGVMGLSVLLLVFYPEELRQSVSGELFTAFFGIAFLFVVVRAISSVLSPTADAFLEDLLDDLAAIYLWLKAHAGPFRIVFVQLEKVCTLRFIAPVLRWLNPRTHPWNLAIVLGVLIGAGLALIEGLSEAAGYQYVGRFLPIVAIFIGLECIGVLLGYVLFAQPLRLFRVQPALKHVL